MLIKCLGNILLLNFSSFSWMVPVGLDPCSTSQGSLYGFSGETEREIFLNSECLKVSILTSKETL